MIPDDTMIKLPARTKQRAAPEAPARASGSRLMWTLLPIILSKPVDCGAPVPISR
ncbi:MAG: hypothetical protein H7306_15335 [Bacteriovorax sp.]|nr:hypothetical protein [Rhizobacter sp.]